MLLSLTWLDLRVNIVDREDKDGVKLLRFGLFLWNGSLGVSVDELLKELRSRAVRRAFTNLVSLSTRNARA